MSDISSVLYYYCPLSTLLGVAESKCLYLSSICFLNDKLEHLWFRKASDGFQWLSYNRC